MYQKSEKLQFFNVHMQNTLKYREKRSSAKAWAHSSDEAFMSLDGAQTFPLAQVPDLHLSETQSVDIVRDHVDVIEAEIKHVHNWMLLRSRADYKE